MHSSLLSEAEYRNVVITDRHVDNVDDDRIENQPKSSRGWGPITRRYFPREAFPREDAQWYVSARCDSRAETYPCASSSENASRGKVRRVNGPRPVTGVTWCGELSATRYQLQLQVRVPDCVVYSHVSHMTDHVTCDSTECRWVDVITSLCCKVCWDWFDTTFFDRLFVSARQTHATLHD